MSNMKKDKVWIEYSNQGYTTIQYAVAAGMVSAISSFAFLCMNSALRRKVMTVVLSVSG